MDLNQGALESTSCTAVPEVMMRQPLGTPQVLLALAAPGLCSMNQVGARRSSAYTLPAPSAATAVVLTNLSTVSEG
jgi:hypothetical protein